ncbi:hypothetical protein JXA80_06290 [bacterium]|nr:hypothetical protein [candidate division CSSED10-310 bacterium]
MKNTLFVTFFIVSALIFISVGIVSTATADESQWIADGFSASPEIPTSNESRISMKSPEIQEPMMKGSQCSTIRLQELYGKYIPSPDTRDLPCDHTPVGPPTDVQVGSQWEWYIWRLNGYPEADLKTCTVRGSSEHAWVVVEDTQWNVNVTQTDVDVILSFFENESIGLFPDQGIWDLNTTHFGMPPDHLDQDGKIYIVFYDFDVSSDGYFWSFDQGCDGDGAFASNECDALYMNCSDHSPSGEYMVSVLAHEFEHLIHYEQDINEAAWVDEGCAELAMWLFGNPDTISMFNNNPDNNLTVWNGDWADYIKTYLWMLYFYENNGGRDAVLDLVAEPANGITGFENFYGDHGFNPDFAFHFALWTVANFLDDPDVGTGDYGYTGDELPPFRAVSEHDTYPVNESATVNHWATDYVRFTGGVPLKIQFDGDDTTQFAVWALERDPITGTRVSRVDLDSAQTGDIDLPDVGTVYEEVVMVFAGTANAGSISYTYSATELPLQTPTPTLTPAPTPTPPWHGDDPAMRLVLNSEIYSSGDEFILDAQFWNPETDPLHVDTFIVLAVLGNYWFWPSWIHLDDGFDSRDMTLPAQVESEENILTFIWPSHTGAASELCFLGVILDHETGFWYGGTLAEACFDYQ